LLNHRKTPGACWAGSPTVSIILGRKASPPK
jgi:hypothetical protein